MLYSVLVVKSLLIAGSMVSSSEIANGVKGVQFNKKSEQEISVTKKSIKPLQLKLVKKGRRLSYKIISS